MHLHRSGSHSVPSDAQRRQGNCRISLPCPAAIDQGFSMMDLHRRRALARLAAVTGAAALPAWAQQAAPKYPVAFVYVSPVSDAGWTFQHDSARREMERAL